ncbi:hypothetical protein HYW42_04845 [Candidatus Daviesbacteria bacterium]|nr:hypothetical protein [Candidatus Daviesbacteria bacterium]
MINERYLPFRQLGPLTDAPVGFFVTVRQPLEAHPKVVVKELNQLMLWPREPNLQPNYRYEEFIEEVVGPMSYFTGPECPFSVYVPPTMCVWGRNEEGKERGFIVMRKVIGQGIESIEAISLEVAESLDKLLALSASDPPVVIDIAKMNSTPAHFHNIVVGKIGSEPDQPYYVDSYPLRVYKLPPSLKLAKMKRQKWTECMKDLKARSNGYSYPLANQVFDKYLEEYLAKLKS